MLGIRDLEDPPVSVLEVKLPGERDDEAAPHRPAAPLVLVVGGRVG